MSGMRTCWSSCNTRRVMRSFGAMRSMIGFTDLREFQMKRAASDITRDEWKRRP